MTAEKSFAISRSQALVLAILPKISACMSMFGNTWIMLEVIFDEDTNRGIRKRENVYNRLMFGMSFFDNLEAVWNFASTWPAPRDTPYIFDPRGTTRTCAVQGFFLQLGLGISMYNAMLSIYYLLVIRYNISERKLRGVVEPVMHTVGFTVAFGTAFAGLFMNLYNWATMWCWIAPYPSTCKDSWHYGAEANCERGDNAWAWRLIFYHGPLLCCIIVAITCMTSVYLAVRKNDIKTLRYRRPEFRIGQPSRSTSNHAENKSERSVSISGDSEVESACKDTFADEIKIQAVVQGDLHDRPSYVFGIPKGQAQSEFDAALRSYNRDLAPFQSSGESTDSVVKDAAPIHYNLSCDLSTSSHPNLEMRSDVHKLSSSVGDSSKSRPYLNASSSNQPISIFSSWREARQQSRSALRNSNEVFDQAMWYLGAFLFVNFFTLTNRTIQFATGQTHYFLTAIHSFVNPLQGFLNFVVYRRPRYMWHRHCGASRWGALCLALKWSKVIDERRGSLGSRSFTADALSSIFNISGLVNCLPRWNEGLKRSRVTRKSSVRAISDTDAEADNEHHHKGDLRVSNEDGACNEHEETEQSVSDEKTVNHLHSHDVVEDLMIDTGTDFANQSVSKIHDFADSCIVQRDSDIPKEENKQEACDQ